MVAALALVPAADVFDTMSVVASPERIRAWLAAALAGDEFVYAPMRRTPLPAGNAGAGTVRVLAAQRLVHPLQRPIEGGARNYVIQRSSAPLPQPRAARPLLSANLRDLLSDEVAMIEAVYPILVRAAQFGLPCPTDKELARKASIKPECVEPLLGAMRAAGIIAVHAVAAPTLRRVTIVGTGAVTGWAK